jgi:alkyl hydroperoxide reductase subunit AhpF
LSAGGGNAGVETVIQLISIAKHIHLIEMQPELTADKSLIENILASDKVKIWTNTKIIEIIGQKVEVHLFLTHQFS